jgi:hypothetical protein
MAATEYGRAPANICVLSSRKSFRAYSVDEHLLIVATLDIPHGYDLRLHRNLLCGGGAPEFTFESTRKPGLWPQDIQTDYHHAEIFRVGQRPDHVRIRHADGVDDLRVGPVAEADDSGFVPRLAETVEEATGLSPNLSFDEAFANAHANLPPIESRDPGQLERITVVETGALFGSVAGFHHLFVKVRRTVD